ncbi:MAG: hypothetical protein HY690_00860 [Chloroflexi bacterium]|nr:hypothetical protein [Chloroflexota bacterium]
MGNMARVRQGCSFLRRAGGRRSCVLDTSLAEIGIAGVAIGAAFAGLRPVAEFQFADYIHPGDPGPAHAAAPRRSGQVGRWRCRRC